MIAGFFKEYRFLSNFYVAKTMYDGEIYPTSEHAFQAAKTLNMEERKQIRELETPAQAKKAGKTITLREDWEKSKVRIMRQIVLDKFTRNPDLAVKLLDTGNETLVEENTWYDIFWGMCKGQGENWLGRILENVRETLSNIRSLETDQKS